MSSPNADGGLCRSSALPVLGREEENAIGQLQAGGAPPPAPHFEAQSVPITLSDREGAKGGDFLCQRAVPRENLIRIAAIDFLTFGGGLMSQLTIASSGRRNPR